MVLPGTEQIGVSPFLLVQVLLLAYALSYWNKYALIIPEKWGGFVFWFSAFSVVSIVSAFILPLVFSGIHVYTPKGGVDEQYKAPGVLALSSSNIAQAVYLLLYWVSIVFFVTRKERKLLDATSSAYFLSGLVVIFFSYYQLASILTGIYYPTKILLNNATFGIAGEATFAFLPRINSTFTEPSFYAMFMASFMAWCYINFINETVSKKLYQWFFLVVVSMLSLLMSASSTGFAAVGFFFLMHTVVSLCVGTDKVKRRRLLLTTLIFVGLMISLYILVPGVDQILNMVIFDKSASDSSIHRLEADRFALEILSETNLLGAGLGSNRPSSFLAFLVSNVGVLGVFCLLMASGILFLRNLKVRRNVISGDKDLVACEASGWALLVMLISKTLAGPDLSFPPMWILAGYFLLSVRQLELRKAGISN